MAKLSENSKILNSSKKETAKDGNISEETGLMLHSQVSVEELVNIVTGPDFPTGGSIYDIEEIKRAYSTGKGKIIMRAKAEIEDIGNGKSAIIVNELPYQVNKAQLIIHIAHLV